MPKDAVRAQWLYERAIKKGSNDQSYHDIEKFLQTGVTVGIIKRLRLKNRNMQKLHRFDTFVLRLLEMTVFILNM